MSSSDKTRDTLDAMARSVMAYRQKGRATPSQQPCRVVDFLTDPRSELKELVNKIGENNDLHHKISNFLPQNLRDRVTHVSLQSGKLTLGAASGAVASQLRFLKIDLLQRLRQANIWSITSIQIKVITR